MATFISKQEQTQEQQLTQARQQIINNTPEIIASVIEEIFTNTLLFERFVSRINQDFKIVKGKWVPNTDIVCQGRTKTGNSCKNKGIETERGYFCKRHSKVSTTPVEEEVVVEAVLCKGFTQQQKPCKNKGKQEYQGEMYCKTHHKTISSVVAEAPDDRFQKEMEKVAEETREIIATQEHSPAGSPILVDDILNANREYELEQAWLEPIQAEAPATPSIDDLIDDIEEEYEYFEKFELKEADMLDYEDLDKDGNDIKYIGFQYYADGVNMYQREFSGGECILGKALSRAQRFAKKNISREVFDGLVFTGEDFEDLKDFKVGDYLLKGNFTIIALEVVEGDGNYLRMILSK